MTKFYVYEPNTGEVWGAEGANAAEAVNALGEIWDPLVEGAMAGETARSEVLVCPSLDFDPASTEVVRMKCRMELHYESSPVRGAPSSRLLEDARAAAEVE